LTCLADIATVPVMSVFTNVLALITTWWPSLLALGALTTAVNQFVQKVVAPRFPRFGNIVNTITVDYVNLLAEVGGALNIGPRAKKPTDGANTVAMVFVVLGFVIGCAGMTAKSIVTEACTVLDSGNPVIGAICLTAEEIASLFGHVKASRAYRASHPAESPNAPVDVCVGEVKP